LIGTTPLNIQAVHDEASDVEAVTKRFFDEFTGRFARRTGLLPGQSGLVDVLHETVEPPRDVCLLSPFKPQAE